MQDQGLIQLEQHSCYAGTQEVWQHTSTTLGCRMNFGVFLPPQAKQRKLPVLYWLSGLSCTEQNAITKAGFQRYAAQHGLIIIAPDTSPRGNDVADDEAYDLGQGAGFYLNATQAPWSQHYQMYDYILHELPALIMQHFPATSKKSIIGHSMGGHGALVLGLRNPTEYNSVSAFAPIVSPSQVPWGQKAFKAYLGENISLWQNYDALELVLQGKTVPHLFIDQGLADSFYINQLRTPDFQQACEKMQLNATIRYHEGYDHSYYFITSFIDEHIAYHAEKLNLG